MADPPPYADSNLDTGGDPGTGPDRDSTTGMPRWAKIFAIIGIVVALGFGILMLAGGGGGSGGHGPPGGQNQEQQVDTNDGGGHAPPEAGHR
jgi:hypothetical protein